MRIFSNILRTFKVSRRESCKITNRRYSSQICPRICVRSFTTTSGSSKNTGAIDGSDKSTTNPIIPVAFLKAEGPNADGPLKILVIPINLFSGDDEAVQKTVSTMSALRNHVEQIEAFAENATAISDRQYMPSRKYNNEMAVGVSRKMHDSLWQDLEIDSNFFGDNKSFYDQIDEAISEYEAKSQAKSSINSLNWVQNKRQVLSDIPENLKKSLGEAAIISMNLAFEMDMTNIKDALMNHSKLSTVEMEHSIPASLKDPTLKLTTGVESESVETQETIPLNFNALIHGTVNIDSSKMTPEKLEKIEVPQFNDYVTAIAANICSTALQKGFPADISRMYSTKTPSGPSKPRSPHIVCVKEGDKGCVSPGNADLDPYVPKGKKAAGSAEPSQQKGGDPCKCSASESTLLTSTIIGDLGARGLMSCKAYARALKEASRLREEAAKKGKDKDCGMKLSKKSDNEDCKEKKYTTIKPCDPSLPCGPPKQDGVCKGKALKDPPPRPPLNNPCRQQDPPCDKKADSHVKSTSVSTVDCAAATKENQMIAAPDSDPPCKKLPYKCPPDQKPSHEEQTDMDNDPCRRMYPDKCPPSTSRGDCKKPIVDPCKEVNKCEKPPKPKKPQDLPCNTGNPCKKASSITTGSITTIPKGDSICSATKPDLVGKPTAPNCPKEQQGNGQKQAKGQPTGIIANPCADKSGSQKSGLGQVTGGMEKKAEPFKDGAGKKVEQTVCAEKKQEASKCGAEKKSASPNCADKKIEPAKCADKKAEPPKCAAEKKSAPPMCGEKKPEAPKCGSGKKPEAPKCAEKRAGPPKCGAEKPEPPKCGAEKKIEQLKFLAKKDGVPKCNQDKIAEASKCAEKKAEPKCAEKKVEVFRCSKPEPLECEEKKADKRDCAEKKVKRLKFMAKTPEEPKPIVVEEKIEPPVFCVGKRAESEKNEPPKASPENKPESSKVSGEKGETIESDPELAEQPTLENIEPKCHLLIRATAPNCDPTKHDAILKAVINAEMTTAVKAEADKLNGTKQQPPKLGAQQNSETEEAAAGISVGKAEEKKFLTTETESTKGVVTKISKVDIKTEIDKEFAKVNAQTSKTCVPSKNERNAAVAKANLEKQPSPSKVDSIKDAVKGLCAPPVIKLSASDKSEENQCFKAIEPQPSNLSPAGNSSTEAEAPKSDVTLPSKLASKKIRKAPRNCGPEEKSTLICASTDMTSDLEEAKKQQSSEKTNKCSNDVLPIRSTKPNCPNNDQPRLFSTFICRKFYTLLPIAFKFDCESILGSLNMSKANDNDDTPTCPSFPPRPSDRKDIRRVPKDCFHQDRLDNPCHKPPPIDPKKTACAKKTPPKKCWEKDDKENKFPQRQSALLQIPARQNTHIIQERSFSMTCAKMQHEKQTKYAIEENTEEVGLAKPTTKQKTPVTDSFSEISNQIIKIGSAGEVLQTVENIKILSDYDALIRIAAIAISGSDIHVYETGSEKCQGMTIGHDATGVVEKVGKCVDRLKPGDCVVMESALSCGICDFCKNGTYNMCPQLFHNGFFSTFQTHPADLCHKIPKNLTIEDATLTSTLALACQACFKAHITPVTSVLIIGTCSTACAAALCARALGAKSVAILSPNVYTLESIRILFDLDYIHYYEDEPNLLAKVNERVCSVLRDRPNVVINYSINESTMNLATNLLQSSGICVLAECDQEHANFNAMDVIMKNITLIPSFRSASMFPTALHLMKSGKTPVGELISRIYTWDQVRWAFHWAQYESNMGNRKVIVQCPENS